MILPTAKTVRTAATKAAIGVFGFFFVGLATHLYDAYLTKGGVELSGVLRTLETIATSTPIAWIVGNNHLGRGGTLARRLPATQRERASTRAGTNWGASGHYRRVDKEALPVLLN